MTGGQERDEVDCFTEEFLFAATSNISGEARHMERHLLPTQEKGLSHCAHPLLEVSSTPGRSCLDVPLRPLV